MKPTATRNPNAKLNGSLLHTPQHIQTKVSKDKGGNKAGIARLQSHKQLINKGNQGSV
jgi:hypothetical protein